MIPYNGGIVVLIQTKQSSPKWIIPYNGGIVVLIQTKQSSTKWMIPYNRDIIATNLEHAANDVIL